MLLSGTVAVRIIAVRVITFMIHLGCSSNGIDTVTTPFPLECHLLSFNDK